MSMMSKLTSSDTGGKAVSKAERALSPFEEMDRYFDSMFRRGWLRPMQWDWPKISEFANLQGTFTPKVDVIDRDKDVFVRAEIPGIEKDKLDVSVTDNTLTLKGSLEREEKQEKGDYYRRETSYGEFVRTIGLPSKVDNEHVKASYKDGILEVTIPKVEQSQHRTIKIE